MLIADTLSRAVIQEQDTSEDDMADEKVIYTLEPTDALSKEYLEKLKGETQKDNALHLILDCYTNLVWGSPLGLWHQHAIDAMPLKKA